MLRRRRVERRSDGTYRLRLDDEERELLKVLVPQLKGPLRDSGTGEVDQALWRLFPNAYEDPARAAEYREMVHDELVRGHLEAIEVMEQTLDAKALDEDQLRCWIGVVNDWRLVLGTRLGVTEDDDLDDRFATGSEAQAYLLYQHLSYLLSDLVDAQLEALPE